jgi:branched-chain amino acid transport system substrate-binding protein
MAEVYMRSITGALAVLAVFVLAAGGCTSRDESGKAEASPIRIGIAGAHSGDLASYGLPTVKAAEVVAAKVNAAGGVLGRQVELLPEDDVCKPEIATNTAQKLLSMEVDAVIGHICSGATRAALGIYRDAGIITISPSATNPPLTKSGDYPNFFRTIAPDDAQARLEVDFALDTLGLTKIAVIHDKGDYGKGLAEFARAFLEEDERAEVTLYEGVTPGAVDYSAVVQKIERSGAEAVIFGGYHPEASKIVMQMRKKGMETVFISDDGVKDDTFIKVAGEFAEGVYATGPKVDEADKGAFYLNAHAAVTALLGAIEAAGSTEYDAVTAALRGQYYETVLGSISFDDKGDAIGVGFSMYQVRNGVYEEVR